MVTYSTNMMGPVATRWYEERNIPFVEESFVSSQTGNTVTHKRYTQYAGGRIDIYGLSADEHYAGKSEYGIPVMLGSDWRALQDWLDELETEDLWSYDLLIREFQFAIGRQITWAPEKPETKTWLDQRANLL